MRKDKYLVLCSIVLSCMAVLSFVATFVTYALGYDAAFPFALDAFVIFVLAAYLTILIDVVLLTHIKIE